MVTGIGTDLVETERVQKAIESTAFLKKVFTEKEQELIAKRPQTAAGNFAVKEAVCKAFQTGFFGIAPRDIEVLRDEKGAPYVNLYNKALQTAQKLGVARVSVSITNTKEYAQATAVCESTETKRPAGLFSMRDGVCKATSEGRLQTESGELCLPILSAAAMKDLDRVTMEEYGISSAVLMERAALGVTGAVTKYDTGEKPIGILCGTGNNGGDGLVVARQLWEEKYNVKVLFLHPEEVLAADFSKGSKEFRDRLTTVKKCGIPVGSFSESPECGLLVDAVFGIGLDRDITGEYKEAFDRMNEEKHIVVAVDMPSGVNADNGRIMGTALLATETVTFGAAKFGLLCDPGRGAAGRVSVADIGFIGEELIKRREAFCLRGIDLPKRAEASNKGTFGKTVVIAGSVNMAGAAYFSAYAAYRTGCGLVKIVTPKENREILQTKLPEAMLTTYEEETDFSQMIKEAAEYADALVIGPGLGTGKTAEVLVQTTSEVLRRMGSEAPVSVWDADALNLLAKRADAEGKKELSERMSFYEELLPQNAVLTPHPGELSRLCNQSIRELTNDFPKTVLELSKQSKAVLVCKDAVTIVGHLGERMVSTCGNNGMATGGSGDTLTGVIAALAAGGLSAMEAATHGVWLHGMAGDVAAAKMGTAPMMARDIAAAIGEIIAESRQ